jgi:EmrB/QacA subfamily drug resistance transporter
MEAIDSTIINTAIPAISQSLGVNSIDLKIALIAYFLSLAIFIPISGWLADKFGSKQIFIFACSIFTLSSLWCGFAPNLITLSIARFIQGLGGALALPVGRLIILRSFGRENLVTTMNHIVSIGALGMMLGPFVGGLITDYFSWRWIFWINIPIGLITVLLAYFWLEDSDVQPVHSLDKTGFILFGTGLSGIIFGFSALSETTINLHLDFRVIFIALIVLVVYIKYSKGQQHPIVKTDLLRFRTFQITVLGNLLSRLGFGAIPFLLPLLFQIGLGKSAALSGLLLAPTALGVLVARQFSLRLLRLLGYKRLLIINTICSGFSIAIFSSIVVQTPIIIIGLFTFLFGLFTSFQYSALYSLAYAEINHDQLSAATSIMSTTQQLAKSLGIAACALFIHSYSISYANLSIITVYHYTFVALALVTLISSLLYIRLKQDDGQLMIGAKK